MTNVLRSYGMAVVLGSLVACSAADTDTVTDNPVHATLTDDTAPPETAYDPALTYKSRFGGDENHSTDRFRFDVTAFNDDAEKAAADKLYPSHAAHIAANHGAIPSVQTIGTYAKQLDDTIYAGVEHAEFAGLAPTIAPKRALLVDAATWLAAHRGAAADDAFAHVAAAIQLGGGSIDVPSDLAASVAGIKSAFLADPTVAKPFGFYTWSDELRAIWQEDRLLQQPLDGASACALAQAIAADSARAARYQTLVGVYSKLTNPLHSSLVDLLANAADASCASRAGQRAFLSTSKTVEVALFEKLYPNGIPADANLMQDLIDAIRAGTVDLAPQADSGWYQYQEYALETLLVTDKAEERSKIAFMARYKKRLQEAFETMLTQHRETHAKQGDSMAVSAVYVPPVPDLRVEPLATVYVRHARSYVFLEAALEKLEGAALLDQGMAIGEGGSTRQSLRTRIRAARDLFYGLYIVSAQDIGMKPKLDAVGDPEPSAWSTLAAKAQNWIDGIGSDPIAAADVRVMIPIAQLDNHRARYWAVIGVRTTLAGYSFIQGSDVSPPKPELQARVPLPTEQFLEVTSSDTPLSREELRALCDAKVSADAIKAALEAR